MISQSQAEHPILIVGASTRAAAFSALRAGFQPICVDQYSDSDLQANAVVRSLPDDPEALRVLLQTWQGVPVIYTGGLENRTDLIEVLSSTCVLWGNAADVVLRVRNPEEIKEIARISRIGFPEFKEETTPPDTDGTWLLRPFAGSGGRGITPWTEDARESSVLKERHFFQERIDGESYSALFIASREPGDIRFIGVTRQLIGLAASHTGGFHWCGNIGPTALPVPTELLLRRFGNVLKWKMGLAGLFGVDFIVDADGAPWVTEVNPRYPASLELLEHAVGIPFLREHARCFVGDSLPETTWDRAHPLAFLGKAILYSPADVQLQQPLADPSRTHVEEWLEVADLPVPGTMLPRESPVCTVFAESDSPEKTMALLVEKLEGTTAQLLASSIPVSNENGGPEAT